MGGKSGGSTGSGSQYIQQQSEPWSGSQPALTKLYTEAENWLNQQKNSGNSFYYPDSLMPSKNTYETQAEDELNASLPQIREQLQQLVKTWQYMANGGAAAPYQDLIRPGLEAVKPTQINYFDPFGGR